MTDIRTELSDMQSDPDPVRRAQIQMKAPLPKRFYKEAAAGPDEEGGFGVFLDGKPVRTPAKAKLRLPNLAAAEAVAAEWSAQESVIDPTKMPITRLANTAIDGIAQDPQAVLDDIVRFSGTDLLCYRADSPQRLALLQSDGWDPVLDWLAGTHGVRFILAEGVMHQVQPQAAIAGFGAVLERHNDPFVLASLHTVTTLTGSAILALAFAQGRLDAEEAWRLAHIDEDWQIAQWGEDEEAAHRRRLRKTELDAAVKLFHALGQKL